MPTRLGEGVPPIRQRLFLILLALALASLIVLTFYPLRKVGLTTFDDMEFYLLSRDSVHHVMKDILHVAQSQGRLFHILFEAIHVVPFLVDNRLYLKAFSLVPIVLNILLFGYVCMRFTASRAVFLSVVVFFLVSAQNSWEHNALTSYPFVFQVGIGFLLVSVLLFLKALEASRRKYLVLSSVFFFLSAAVYEAFLSYVALFLLLAAYPGRNPSEAWMGWMKRTLRLWVPYLGACAFYFVLYLGFQRLYPLRYDGMQISGFSLADYLKTLCQFSLSSLPMSIFLFRFPLYKRVIAAYSEPIVGGPFAWANVLAHLEAAWIVKALLASGVFYFALRSKERVFRGSGFVGVLTLSLALMFLPETLISLTVKYQDWVVRMGARFYTVTFFSFFGTVLLFVTTFLYLGQILSRREAVHRSYCILASAAVAVTSLVTDYTNHAVTSDQARAQARWEAIDRFLETEAFRSIPARSTLYFPILNRYWGQPADDTFAKFIGSYIRAKTRKHLALTPRKRRIWKLAKEADLRSSPFYFLKYIHERREPSPLLAFARITGMEGAEDRVRLYGEDARLYTDAKDGRFRLRFTLRGEGGSAELRVDGNSAIIEERDGRVSVLVNKESEKGPVIETAVFCERTLDLETLSISRDTE